MIRLFLKLWAAIIVGLVVGAALVLGVILLLEWNETAGLLLLGLALTGFLALMLAILLED